MSTTIVTVKYPFDIKNLKPRVIAMSSPFCSGEDVTTFNVETFSAVKFECTQRMKKLKEEHPGYTHKIYAWRATSQLPKDSTQVCRLKFTTTLNKHKNESHTVMELLPALLEPQPLEREDFTTVPRRSRAPQ